MLSISRPENYLSSSNKSMTYEESSSKEDAARRRLESEFNDDDYWIAGTPAPSIRHHLYTPSSSSKSHRAPPDYASYVTNTRKETGGGNRYSREGSQEPRNGGAYSSMEPPYSTSRIRSTASYDQPSMNPRGGGWWDRPGYESYYTERKPYNSVPTTSSRGYRPSDSYRPLDSGRGLDYTGRGRDEYDNGRIDEGPRESGYSNGSISGRVMVHRNNNGTSYNNGEERFGRLDDHVRLDSRDSRPSATGYSRRSSERLSPERPYGRQGSKILFDGAAEEKKKERQFYEQTRANPKPPQEREFLGKVQRELEEHRREWKDEMDRLSNSTLMPSESTTFNVSKDSTIDTSSGQAIFKAFVDVSEFPPSSVKVNVDKLTNKVVVEAKQSAAGGGMAKSFTQKIQLPRWADDVNLVARMNKKGILKVEVPLVFYWPEQEKGSDSSKAKSFVYEVRTDPVTGSKTMEILVNTGRDMSSKDLKVEIDGDKLQIWADRPTGSAGSTSPGGGDEPRRTLIKQYTLPPNADSYRIRVERTKDGRHAILVPLY